MRRISNIAVASLVLPFVLTPFLLYAETVDVSVSVQLFACSDGTDNDSDGLIDFPNDPGCISGGDDDEINPRCNDNLDNDSDGLIDFPNDPGCDDLQDDDETDLVFPSTSDGGSSVSSGLRAPRATQVVFTGLAQPDSQVTLLKDALFVADTVADADATFRMSLSDVSVGNHVFSMYGTDIDGVRSGLVSFTVMVQESFLVEISNIFIPPTIYILEEDGDETVTISGQTVPDAAVTVAVFSRGIERERFGTFSDNSGRYSQTFISPVFSGGDAPVKSFAVFGNLISPFGAAAAILSSLNDAFLPGDFNRDRRIDLVDFSMLAFWYKQFDADSRFDLSGDSVVDLVDVSIMASNWTG